MPSNNSNDSFHNNNLSAQADLFTTKRRITYCFGRHYHPFTGDFIAKLNKTGIGGFLDVDFQDRLDKPFFDEYQPTPNGTDETMFIEEPTTDLDLYTDGAYAVYNWELFFHAPLLVAVHLSKNQRYAEAQKWFHYIFDPTSNDPVTVPNKPHLRFWKFLSFRKTTTVELIDDLMVALAEGVDSELKKRMEAAIAGSRNKPFQPHVIARTRFEAYQLNVVMSYLDNLFAWGDSLFRQDTMESINEATQIYVLAANILGPRPLEVPSRGRIRSKTFAQLRGKLDAMGNALVELEGEFPFNLNLPTTPNAGAGESAALWGIGRSLYFCIPKNDKLLGYWGTVADRLYKIRNCLNLQGIFRKLALFDPPIDPGMLVKAAAAGIDITSMVGGMNQPTSSVRAALFIQKALEICGEVKGLGGSLLSAIEKKEGEELGLLRQAHELKILTLTQDVRYLQWKEAEANTEALLKTRDSAFQRYRYYQTLMGIADSETTKLQSISVERKMLTEGNFDEIYKDWVEAYSPDASLMPYPDSIEVKNDKSLLSQNENTELNVLLPSAYGAQVGVGVSNLIAGVLSLIPQGEIAGQPLGIGGNIGYGGIQLSTNASTVAKSFQIVADLANFMANRTAKTASYQRRVEDWTFQRNNAAVELTQIGRQLIASLIREQSARREYENHKVQIENAQAVDEFLKSKFAGKDLYGWMQGQISKIYYETYKFAFDIARKAEVTMKAELMRPELDGQDFIQFGYWDGGRKGLLAGEKLYLDLRRLEMAYHDHNRREYELTKHVSLLQLDPIALLSLKVNGSCEFTIPESAFDMDSPGHYMRRIKSVSLTIPCIVGPYTSVNCTLTLQKSSIRKDPSLSTDGNYGRESSEDPRFRDYFGSIQSIVTSNAQNDSGMFETNLRDERYLPFELAGAESTWRLEIPAGIKQFDYNTISDVLLHIRYTAREGGAQLRTEAVKYFNSLFGTTDGTREFGRLFSLQNEFPNEWHEFSNNSLPLDIILKKEYFPYYTKGKDISILKIELLDIIPGQNPLRVTTLVHSQGNWDAFSVLLNNSPDPQNPAILHLTIPEVVKTSEVNFMVVKYQLAL
jgi:hypothetical protein